MAKKKKTTDRTRRRKNERGDAETSNKEGKLREVKEKKMSYE